MIPDPQRREQETGTALAGLHGDGASSLAGDPRRPLDLPTGWSVLNRLMSKLVVDERGCWVWTGSTNGAGYGHFGVAGKTVYTHRVAFELFVGPIREGFTIDHLCRTSLCCNPWHLEPVTQAENNRRADPRPRGVRPKATHCKRGHEFTPENTYTSSRGERRCRICLTQSRKAYRAARRARRAAL